MSKSLELVWSEQEPVRVFSTAHFQSAASQFGSNRLIQVGEHHHAIFPAPTGLFKWATPIAPFSRLEHILTIPHVPFPLTQALLRLDLSWDPLRNPPAISKAGEQFSTKNDLSGRSIRV